MPAARRLILAVLFGATYAASALARPPRLDDEARANAAEQAPAPSEVDSVTAAAERVAEASVVIIPKGCAGAIVGTPLHVLTAAHCIPEGMQRVPVRLRGGQKLGSQVELLDRDRDLALLHLDAEAAVAPLELSERLPNAGDGVLFVGRFDRYVRPQLASVVRIGRCPSMPNIDDAVFTSLNARPGDSGAPIVDEELRVLAVIHGGAACHIAAPVHTLARALRASESGELEPGALARPAEPHHVSPWVWPFEFGFRFSFGPRR